MKKLIIILAVVIFMSLGSVGKVNAQEMASSANPSKEPSVEIKKDERVGKLENFFAKQKSPLQNYAEALVKTADKYDIDYRLLPAISGVESTFAKFYIYGTFNAYGWAGGLYKFTSWENSFEVVLSSLRKNYFDKGASTIESIARIYCPPNSANWAKNVQYFEDKISQTSAIASVDDLNLSL